ncbi:hypothetical protein [Streptomyces sp. NPDC048269]|uniref:hypothetical protein n=1 Tax=Streptomyces sp. NPDC048269 TaxID=3155753 RepID=UPI00342AF8EF
MDGHPVLTILPAADLDRARALPARSCSPDRTSTAAMVQDRAGEAEQASVVQAVLLFLV